MKYFFALFLLLLSVQWSVYADELLVDGFHYTAQAGQELVVQSFSKDKLELPSCQDAEKVYSFTKQIWQDIKNDFSDCAPKTAVRYSDKEVYRTALYGNKNATRCAIPKSLYIHTRHKCAGSEEKELEINWEIQKTNGNCTAVMLVNGLVKTKSDSSNCNLYNYVHSQKNLIHQQIETLK